MEIVYDFYNLSTIVSQEKFKFSDEDYAISKNPNVKISMCASGIKSLIFKF